MRRFQEHRQSGTLEIVLHFRRGELMPSDITLTVSEKAAAEAGPADSLFGVRRA